MTIDHSFSLSLPPIGWRVTPRVASNIPVRLRLSEAAQTIAAHTRDIGTGGLCVVSHQRFALSQASDIQIPFTGREIATNVTGRWQDIVGDETVLTGLSFDDLELTDLFAVWEFVQLRAREITQFLFSHASLCDMDFSELLDIALVSRLRNVDAKSAVCDHKTEIERGESIFIVFRGSVRLSLTYRHARISTIDLAEGSLFGGLSWLLGAGNTEAAVASSDSLLLELDPFALRWLQISRPLVLHRLLRALTSTYQERSMDATRIRFMDQHRQLLVDPWEPYEP